MKKHVVLLLTFTFSCILHNTFAQCTETDEPKVLLIGDSWAFFMGVDQTINRALEKWGHSHYTFFTNTILAENGAETDDFLKPDKQAEIIAQFDANPSIEVVHLSIGGNDFLGDWNIDLTQAQTDSMMETVEVRLLQVIDFIKSVKPGIRILWSGYTYPNFEEVIEDSDPFQTNHPFYSTWEGMGFPSFLQINQLQDSVAHKMEVYAASDPQVDFVNAPGILQYTFGQNDPVSVPPGGSYAANTAPLPYGYPDYPSPKEAMRDYFLTKDCFHLSPKGYDDMVGYQLQKFYHKFLMDDQYLLAEESSQNGSVATNGTTSTELMMGESGGQTFSTLLSFNTTQMPDTLLTAASLFLRRKNLNGINPISSNLQIKIINGHFGMSADLEATDLSAVADATDTPCLFGSNGGDGHWIRLDLPAIMLPFINHTATTQFLLSAPNATGGVVSFNEVSDPDFAPVLNLTFKHFGVDIEDEINENESFILYPNPTKGLLKIANKQVRSVALYSIWGEKVFQAPVKDEMIDIATLPDGIYFVHLKTDKETIIKRVIKQ